ncbi:hypothetical protein Pmgp_01795 [Pelotomaculum propionicicum]|uniref:Uncharacterized protein n=2 Tax=Pelotomaculum propionicicum TaxID=258475 RepID=A0A4Y7RR76_9FIRM|nr:hypothetical protein Pmgp_01795 [Pelotomaculum propionicicum]
MVEFLGWIGFLLFLGTLVPFFTRRIRLNGASIKLLSQNHHAIALASLAALTLHGFFALSSGRHWGRGAGVHVNGNILSGVLAWTALAAVVAIALKASRHKPFVRTHCLVVILLALLVTVHVF